VSGEVFIRAVGAVTSAGMGLGALERALGDPDWQPVVGLDRPDTVQLSATTCPDLDTKGVLPPLVARRLDRPARLLVVAAKECLANDPESAAWPRFQVGVTAGTWNAGTTALVEVLRAVFFVTPEEAPPAQFPSTVTNAPASQLGILEQLAGPNLTFFEKQAGGLRALAEASRMLRCGRAPFFLACGVDETNWVNAEAYDRLRALRRPNRAGMVLAEGAAVLALGPQPGAQPLARVAGWGAASEPTPPYLYAARPDAVLAACRQALGRAAIRTGDVDLVVSMTNGIPALDRLEVEAMRALFGDHRPAAVALTDRLGEGAFASALRPLVAALIIGRGLLPRWAPPAHLASVGFPRLTAKPRAVLVAATGGGGSAVATVLTAA
jgi:3-oxoacyl-[acyl-carrier-protein] synthase II